mgnify:CR=1 FL=1
MGPSALAARSADGTDMLPLVREGDRFYTPSEDLEAAKRHRAVYTPKGVRS